MYAITINKKIEYKNFESAIEACVFAILYLNGKNWDWCFYGK